MPSANVPDRLFMEKRDFIVADVSEMASNARAPLTYF
jgi:hypothetical protein